MRKSEARSPSRSVTISSAPLCSTSLTASIASRKLVSSARTAGSGAFGVGPPSSRSGSPAVSTASLATAGSRGRLVIQLRRVFVEERDDHLAVDADLESLDDDLVGRLQVLAPMKRNPGLGRDLRTAIVAPAAKPRR